MLDPFGPNFIDVNVNCGHNATCDGLRGNGIESCLAMNQDSHCDLPMTDVRCQYVTSETSLRAAILTGYDTDIRPYAVTTVTTSLGLMALNKLDMSAQMMSLTAFWYTVWHDTRLTWDPTVYGGITQLVLSHKKIWKPPLIVKNEMNKIGMLSEAVVPLRIVSSGYVIWVAPITMNTICEVNVQSYPFDSQECLVELAPWGYSTCDRPPVDMKHLAMNPNSSDDLIKKS
ncbi:acetylcholine receptor subunit alpha-like 2 [Gigantopelta aegis]|uniref:acetylcholine receptor subunit alpha-like 2 n=1 Tax=Gigantopelta aegis TaxID=1735272 RepID=UPI001B888FBD|nr:acetylcholine receptor subunit alpha-like 2 [Gigantopelta aegis]